MPIPSVPWSATPKTRNAPMTHGRRPPQTLRTLLDLARQGNIGALREHAERLATLDPMHAAFAARMGAYLDGFQMKKLRQWLEQIDRR